MPVLLEYCLPLVCKGGGFLAMKGPEGEEEAKAAIRAAKALGAGDPQIVRLDLPRSAGARTLVWYEKKFKTAQTYPRRPGVPAKTPL
jgi:16S rRNA (guanine527-N7)-methyltransferase